MTERLTRVYRRMDIQQIKSHVLVYGDLSASCDNCQAMELRLEHTHCPQCKTEFKYIAFRNVKNHLPKILKILAERPGLVIVDFDDYKRNLGAIKAEEFLR